ncbi:MAG: DUF2007 domain-containing protein [Verrucomicrobiae bacterium]|nr:DUF2007 domain-containing protein [Verrucomicrobiae bacterium]
MITIASFSTSEEAYLLRSRLEASGIAAFVQDEHMIQMNWLYSNAIGGVRVQVFDQQGEEAREILRDERSQTVLESTATLCPRCGSGDTERIELTRRLSLISVMIFNFPLPVLKNRFRCEHCGNRWKEEPNLEWVGEESHQTLASEIS